jgi:hypothetical protein
MIRYALLTDGAVFGEGADMMARSQRRMVAWAVCASLTIVATAARAETQPTSSGPDGWQFTLTPYLWLAGQSGNVRIGQVIPGQNVDAHFSNIWRDLDFGVMAAFEARKGRWAIIVDGFYVNVSTTSEPILGGRLGTARLQLDNGIVQAVGAYRILPSDKTPVDFIAGLRYTNLNAKLSFSPSPVLPAGDQRSTNVDWVDALVGLRAFYRFADNWSVMGYADVGTGGAKYSWQLIASVSWDVSKTIGMTAGYRILAQDYNTSSFYYNVRTAGPFAGAHIKF